MILARTPGENEEGLPDAVALLKVSPRLLRQPDLTQPILSRQSRQHVLKVGCCRYLGRKKAHEPFTAR